ncbi:hypothetical protein Hanom_Chr08g00756151 [Helianthus anomalus]
MYENLRTNVKNSKRYSGTEETRNIWFLQRMCKWARIACAAEYAGIPFDSRDGEGEGDQVVMVRSHVKRWRG